MGPKAEVFPFVAKSGEPSDLFLYQSKIRGSEAVDIIA